jgi:hypothetical protein
MRTTIGRFTAAAAAALLAGAMAAAPAGAQAAAKPESFVGEATSSALELSLAGQRLTLGFTKADVDSVLKAVAEGAGQLLVPATTTKAEAVGDNVTESDLDRCGPITLPAELAALLKVATACSSSASEVKGGAPKASSVASVGAIDLLGNTVLNQVIQPIQPVLEQIFGQLSQVAPQLDPVTATVGDLVTAVGSTQTLAIRLGNATSESVTTAGQVASTASAAGGQIDILPLGGLNQAPLASIIVGSARTVAAYDRAKGVSSATADPALVTVKLNLPGGLVPPQTISVAPGQEITILAGTPLESTIRVAKATTSVDPATQKATAVADGVSLELLKGLSGGVTLRLAHATSTVTGAPAVPVVEVARELPRTGGEGWVPAVGAAMVGAALVARRLTLRAARR